MTTSRKVTAKSKKRPKKQTKAKEPALHSSPLINHLLIRRGITTKEDADRFLNPSYHEHLHDPFLMLGMDVAVERILHAIDTNERVLIYSDFDADGIPGAVVLHDFFVKIGFTNFTNYIPHRHDEGFGVHLDAVDQFKEDGVDLIITIDCGIADVEEVARAREHDIDVIITDHHEPPSSLNASAGQKNKKASGATATLNPKQPGCAYPFSELCGAGVTFKLVQALLASRSFDVSDGWEKWLLDMVGLATLSDMVPLVGENRVFASYGLLVLRKSRRPGIMKLCRELRLKQAHLTEDDVGFMIAPRINAASRMGVPMDAFTFLSTIDTAEADRVVKHLNEINDKRKGVVASMIKEIRKKIDHQNNGTVKNVIVAGDPTWKPSLLGLAANTIAEEYDRPVFLWGRDGRETIKGSARSNGRIDLVALMDKARDGLESYGGHQLAGGFSVSHTKIHSLDEALTRAVESIKEEELQPTIELVDTDLTLDDINEHVYREIEKLAPFGVGNQKPTFRFRGVVIENVRTFGKQNNHLELTFRVNEKHLVKAIGFFTAVGDYAVSLTSGEKVTMVATMERSLFRGFAEMRLRIVDVY